MPARPHSTHPSASWESSGVALGHAEERHERRSTDRRDAVTGVIGILGELQTPLATPAMRVILTDRGRPTGPESGSALRRSPLRPVSRWFDRSQPTVLNLLAVTIIGGVIVAVVVAIIF